MTPPNLIDALNSLFAEIDPETPDEIDAIIRSVGIDPETYAAEMARRVADIISKARVACHWQLVNTPANDEMWRGDCGILWVFTDVGTPQEHNVKFCPYCGRAVKVAEWRAQ